MHTTHTHARAHTQAIPTYRADLTGCAPVSDTHPCLFYTAVVIMIVRTGVKMIIIIVDRSIPRSSIYSIEEYILSSKTEYSIC